MDVWKAVPLKDKKSIVERFFFRLLWCSVGAVFGFLFIGQSRVLLITLPLFVIIISVLGAIVDNFRLPAIKKEIEAPQGGAKKI